MELPELSLAPTQVHLGGVNNASRKRKLFQDHNLLMKTNNHQPSLQAHVVDIQLKDPLPLDWEQCLDLESGKIYYMNRRTLRKSWNWPIPMEHLDIELSICGDNSNYSDHNKRQNHLSTSDNMGALACLNCHLLVILSKSSPSCPNCKYVHSLPSITAASQEPNVAAVKSLNTLSLLN